MKLSKWYIYIMITGILSWLVVFLGQIFSNLWLSLVEIAILPYSLVVLLMLPVIIRRRQRFTRKNIRPLFVFWFVGVFGVVSQFGWIFFNVPVAVIVLLLYTQPLRTILLSGILLKEKIKRFHIISCLFVLCWIFFLAYPFNTGIVISPIGIAIGLFAGICLSFRVMTGARVSRKDIDPYFINFSETAFMIILLLIASPLLAWLFPNPGITGLHINHGWTVWLLCIWYAVFANIIPHVTYFKGIKKVSAMTAGIILLLEPVTAALLAMIFLHQALTVYIIIWGILILIGNIFVMVYGDNT